MKRYAPLNKKRKRPRRGEPTPLEKTAARLDVYDRSGGLCELRVAPNCIKGVLPFDGPDDLSHGHLVHHKAKRRFGWMPSNQQRHYWGCWPCHKWLHNGGKPCPPKPSH